MSYDKAKELAEDIELHTGGFLDSEEALALAGYLLEDPDWEIIHHPEPSTKQDSAEAALALHADEFAQKVVDAVKAHLEKQGAKKARDCTDQRGHRFTVEYPPEGQFGWTRTFCERCGAKP